MGKRKSASVVPGGPGKWYAMNRAARTKLQKPTLKPNVGGWGPVGSRYQNREEEKLISKCIRAIREFMESPEKKLPDDTEDKVKERTKEKMNSINKKFGKAFDSALARLAECGYFSGKKDEAKTDSKTA